MERIALVGGFGFARAPLRLQLVGQLGTVSPHHRVPASPSASSNPEAFRDALPEGDQVGFVLGGGDGYGHGVFATGRARLVVTDFRVE